MEERIGCFRRSIESPPFEQPWRPQPQTKHRKSPFFIASHSIGQDHCQGNRVAWRQTKMARNSSLRFDAATPETTASCFSPSTVLISRISGSKWRERTCSLFCICAVHSFTLIVVFTTLSFVFILLSVLTLYQCENQMDL